MLKSLCARTTSNPLSVLCSIIHTDCTGLAVWTAASPNPHKIPEALFFLFFGRSYIYSVERERERSSTDRQGSGAQTVGRKRTGSRCTHAHIGQLTAAVFFNTFSLQGLLSLSLLTPLPQNTNKPRKWGMGNGGIIPAFRNGSSTTNTRRSPLPQTLQL